MKILFSVWWVAIFVLAFSFDVSAKQQSFGWVSSHVTSYSPREPGVSSFTACPRPFHRLIDSHYTVALSPREGFSQAMCGRHINIKCKKSKVCWKKDKRDGSYYHTARITDTTACTLSFCDLELSYSTSQLMGAPAQSGQLTWTGYIVWRFV